MSSIDTLKLTGTVEQSTFAFNKEWISYEASGSTFPIQLPPQSLPTVAYWSRFIAGIRFQGLSNNTATKNGGSLAMDAYWDGSIRNRRMVLSALSKTPKLNGVLVQAQSRLAIAFVGGQLVLEGDPDGEQLYIVVETSLDVESAREVLSEFDRSWWFQNMDDANGNLSVILDFV